MTFIEQQLAAMEAAGDTRGSSHIRTLQGLPFLTQDVAKAIEAAGPEGIPRYVLAQQLQRKESTLCGQINRLENLGLIFWRQGEAGLHYCVETRRNVRLYFHHTFKTEADDVCY